MNQQVVIQKTKEYIEQKFSSESTGHDWWHMHRVWRLSKRLAESEPDVDMFVVELAALLHDIADWKFHDGDMEAGPKAAREWLSSLQVSEEIISKIEDIIRNISFRGAQVKQDMKSIEGQIVSDADKLDAMGAIGIARAFAYGGAHNHAIYDPNLKPTLHNSFEAYKTSKSSSVNHFYEKLLLLQGMLYTKAAKDIARRRHKFMEAYLDEFSKEWEGLV